MMEGNRKCLIKRKAERELLYAEINRLKMINKKLEDENRRLRENSEKIEEYRKEYEQLIQSIERMQKINCPPCQGHF